VQCFLFIKMAKMVCWFPICKRMRNRTGRKVEKRAVFELVDYIEGHIDRIILQVVAEHERLNDLRESQGIYQKVMIDCECVRNAIKTINSQSYSLLPEKAGGNNNRCIRKVGVLNGKKKTGVSEVPREVEIA